MNKSPTFQRSQARRMVKGIHRDKNRKTIIPATLEDLFPEVLMLTKCPQPGCVSHHSYAWCQIELIIPHLNDDHRWSREKIAWWLDFEFGGVRCRL